MKAPQSSSPTAAIVLSVLMSLTLGSALADELDNLLNPAEDTATLVDQSATKAWNEVVAAFRKNDLTKASELGQAFLDGDFRPTPYQLLGVKVMMGLANAATPSATPDATLTAEEDKLMAERNELTTKYGRLKKIVTVGEATINKLTNNRKQAVQVGTAAYRECMRCSAEITQATAEMAAMKPDIDEMKRKTADLKSLQNSKLKADTLQLLDMLTQAGEVEAAFAVTNVYIRVIGSDLEIAKKQQDVVRLQAVEQKASKIVDVILSQQKPLVSEKKYWAARAIGQRSHSKVQQQSNDVDLTRMVTSKLALDPLSINATIAKAESEAGAVSKLSKVDSRKAALALRQFRNTYPDYPNYGALGMEIAGDRSGEMKGKLAALVASIEALAETDPNQASAMLAQLDAPEVDPAERMALQARISAARGKVITASVMGMKNTLAEAKDKLGGEVREFLIQNSERIQKGWFGKEQTDLTASLKLKIDKSAELPEVRATLEGLNATIIEIELLQPSETQTMQMAGIKAEVRALRAAIK